MVDHFEKWSTGAGREGFFNGVFAFPPDLGKFDRIVLKYTLNCVEGLVQRRQIRDAGLALLKPGGALIAVSRAFDSGKDLAEALVRVGVPTARLGSRNLTNKEIATLKPKGATMLNDFRVLRRTRRTNNGPAEVRRFLEETLKFRNLELEDDQAAGLPESLRANIIDIALLWEKK